MLVYLFLLYQFKHLAGRVLKVQLCTSWLRAGRVDVDVWASSRAVCILNRWMNAHVYENNIAIDSGSSCCPYRVWWDVQIVSGSANFIKVYLIWKALGSNKLHMYVARFTKIGSCIRWRIWFWKSSHLGKKTLLL